MIYGISLGTARSIGIIQLFTPLFGKLFLVMRRYYYLNKLR